MTDNVTQFPAPPPKAELKMVGPFQEWRVVVDGRFVPNLTAFEDKSFGDGISLVVDHRFSIWVERDRAPDVAWLLAQAMAVAAGYPHFSADSKERPFASIACEMSADFQPKPTE